MYELDEVLVTSHKGRWCILNPGLRCQEGFCSGCYLWTKWDTLLKAIQLGREA